MAIKAKVTAVVINLTQASPALVFAAASLLIAQVAPAHATLNAEFGFVPFGTTSYIGTDIGDATSVIFPSNLVVNTDGGPFYNGATNPNQFYAGPYAPHLYSSVTLSPLILAVSSICHGGSAICDAALFMPIVPISNFLVFTGNGFGTGTTPLDRYSFTLTLERWSSSASGNLSFNGLGFFDDAGGTFASNIAELSFSLIEGSTIAPTHGIINASFIFETAGNGTIQLIPEPATLALVGLGLLGLGAVRRRS